MVLFWVIVALMVLLGLWFVLPALASKSTSALLGHKDLNVSIYRQKLTELEENEENLNPEQIAQVRQEIELGLLQDADDQAPTASGISTQAQKLTVMVVALCIPLLAFSLYSRLAPEPFEQLLSYEPAATKARKNNLPPVQEMVAKLEAKMQQSPDDAQGWQLLGRSYFVMGRYDDAAMSYGRAHALLGDEPDLLADYAEALAMSQGGGMKGQPDKLIDKSLAKQAQHPKSLWLGGLAAFQTGRYQMAIQRWQTLLSMHPDKQSEGVKVLQQRIAEARQHLGGNTSTAKLASSKPSTTPKTTTKTVVHVQIELDPKLKAKASASDTVFIFARAVQGPPMPLAIVKKQVKDLPITVQLDDSMAMMANMSMSSFPQVYIGARISKSGNAMPQAGDLQGRSTPLKTGGKQKSVKISINTEVL